VRHRPTMSNSGVVMRRCQRPGLRPASPHKAPDKFHVIHVICICPTLEIRYPVPVFSRLTHHRKLQNREGIKTVLWNRNRNRNWNRNRRNRNRRNRNFLTSITGTGTVIGLKVRTGTVINYSSGTGTRTGTGTGTFLK
jgi:hypothetical protein